MMIPTMVDILGLLLVCYLMALYSKLQHNRIRRQREVWHQDQRKRDEEPKACTAVLQQYGGHELGALRHIRKEDRA